MPSLHARPALFVCNTLSDEHDVIVAPDDNHAPVIQAGDLLVVDPASKAPRLGEFYAVTYQTRTGPRLYVMQCRRIAPFCSEKETYVLGASLDRGMADGPVDADHFASLVQGRIIGVLREREPTMASFCVYMAWWNDLNDCERARWLRRTADSVGAGLDRCDREQPATDEQLGMAWWNHLGERERATWLRRAGSAVVADAWAAFKAGPSFAESRR